MPKENKQIRCRVCKESFNPLYRNGIIISRLCITCLSAKGKKKIWKEEKKKIKDSLKTKSEWLNDLQRVFNKYIRERDKNKPCISCDCKMTGKFDAGHYFTVGAYPNIRFNEDNVHGQCVACNQHRHGNITEYSIRLPIRIGQERFDQLLIDRSKSLNITIEEIKEKIAYYKQAVKKYLNN